jgi:diaminohydroxyphosphoribosylaminopyrimidine deaminase/5-amino-6-(5-phosphoribosylamino)uracil reductase
MVVAVIDPTSRGAGGVAELRRAGVEVETGVLAAEACIVLGGWLAALGLRRPVITWPYLLGGRGIEALPPDTTEARALRLNADAVLSSGGVVREAVPGRHGTGILALQGQPLGSSATEVAASLFDGGVRCLLLDGGPDVAAPFLSSGMVDRVLAYMAPPSASRRPPGGLAWPLLPRGFLITDTFRTETFVRVEGRPEGLSQRGAYQRHARRSWT